MKGCPGRGHFCWLFTRLAKDELEHRANRAASVDGWHDNPPTHAALEVAQNFVGDRLLHDRLLPTKNQHRNHILRWILSDSDHEDQHSRRPFCQKGSWLADTDLILDTPGGVASSNAQSSETSPGGGVEAIMAISHRNSPCCLVDFTTATTETPLTTMGGLPRSAAEPGTNPGTGPHDLAPPYVFDPVTAEVSMVEDNGELEVVVFDADGRMDGVLLATPLDDHIRIDASFPDGYVSFELVVLEDNVGLRNVDMGLDQHDAEYRISTMLAFAAPFDPGQGDPITRRGCMVRFATISALCAAAIAVPPVWSAAVVGCTTALIHTYCECLPLLGYDPCN